MASSSMRDLIKKFSHRASEAPFHIQSVSSTDQPEGAAHAEFVICDQTIDITYIRLAQGFAYLAAILDAYSRRVVGWRLSREIDAALAVSALEMALEARKPAPGWIHHSDRGVQYACREYVERLTGAQAQISMSAKGTPRDNAQAESLMRTLKQEEVYLHDYQTFDDAEPSLGHFIDRVYNEKRLHSSLGYLPPSEFEELLAAGVL
jgi:transposase InsO family protein